MKKLLWCLLVLSTLNACVSRYGHDVLLKKETEQSIQTKIIRGQTTRQDIEQWLGKESPEWGMCYGYVESTMPIYNFLPTNMLYMGGVRTTWKLCVQYDEQQRVQDYQFERIEKSTAISPLGTIFTDLPRIVRERHHQP